MPLVSKTFSEIITFTRASTGTYYNAAGTLTSAAINEPRLDYNPSTLAAQGLLIEEARTNLITSSAVLPAGINVTITADTFVAPDGTTTGDQILDNTTLGEHYTDSSFTPTATTNYTFSAFIKNIGASSSGFACLRLAGDFSAFVIVNLSTFTVSTTGGAQYVSSSVQAINNGWYKISVTGVSVSTTASVARLQVTDASNLTPYIGIGEGFAAWGRQLEAGAFPTSYIPTTTIALTRAADVANVNTLSPWFNASEGTLFAEYNIPYALTTGSGPRLFALNGVGGPAIDEMPLLISQAAGKAASFNSFAASVNAGRIDATPAFVANTVTKAAAGYATNSRAVTANASTSVTSTTVYTIPTITIARLGSQDSFGNNAINGWLRRLSYYPRKLSDAELQSLTT